MQYIYWFVTHNVRSKFLVSFHRVNKCTEVALTGMKFYDNIILVNLNKSMWPCLIWICIEQENLSYF